MPGRQRRTRELDAGGRKPRGLFPRNCGCLFFRESWPGPTLVSWELGEREANPQGSRFFAANDVLLTLPWQLHGPWGVSECVWYFQKSGILETLGNGQTPLQETLDDKTAATRKQSLVNSLPLQLEFVLGTTEVRLSELSRLQVGDDHHARSAPR